MRQLSCKPLFEQRFLRRMPCNNCRIKMWWQWSVPSCPVPCGQEDMVFTKVGEVFFVFFLHCVTPHFSIKTVMLIYVFFVVMQIASSINLLNFGQYHLLYSAHRIQINVDLGRGYFYCCRCAVCVHQGDTDMKLDDGRGLDNSLRTRRQRFKPEVSFSEVELKTSSPVTDASGGGCTR